MTWTDARNRLMADLESLNEPVHLTPPQNIDDESIHVYIVPPGRTVSRRATHVRRTTYDQGIVVMKHVPSEGDKDVDEIALAIDEHVEGINTVLDGNLKLGGLAVSVSPPNWDDMTVTEWPAGSGVLYAQMAGRIEIEIETVTTFGPGVPAVLALESVGNLQLEG